MIKSFRMPEESGRVCQREATPSGRHGQNLRL
jgi:hypothetical protein